ncbi:Branched-chain amino acid transport protein [Noviherbaspirillum humi]|uniref:Branched-chain amino acid transport protein n=1 Tax=Noviherbaspirillum humi TaxID=1688639 RepID=A0A239E3B5_9BURK|nr:AzlD domain-containing protein [Noviherbaspirillum humi]SNS38483.1 Branched-chain amino acid transport protein [Noviherbaspirillum humi]
MSSADFWITIGLLTLATFLTRGSFFLLGNAVKLPPRLQHALRYAPAAAMAAIIAPDLLLAPGSVALDWFNPRLLAAIGAAIFFLATRRLLGTIIVGMALFTVFRFLM